MPTATTLVSVDQRPKLDPAYDRLREIYSAGRKNAEQFATELFRLHQRFCRNKNDNLNVGSSPKYHGETSGGDAENEGFKEVVARELRISPVTAYRHLHFAEALLICERVSAAPEGETIELSGGKKYLIEKEHRDKARALRESLLAQETPMNRALPAAKGLFLVEGGGIGGKGATNHPQNMWAGVQKLRTSMRLEHWRQGTMKDGKDGWDRLVDEWSALIRQLPDELRACTAAVLAKTARK